VEKGITIKDVLKVFPHLNRRTLGAWVERGIIEPAVPSSGERVAAKFDEKNCVEIGTVIQLNRAGVDSYKTLRRILQHPTSQPDMPLINYLRFDDFLILPMPPIFGPELTEDDEVKFRDPFTRRADQMGDFFNAPLPAGGWIVIDVRPIKGFVRRQLANL
jgi:hypothetical protein